MSRATGCYWRLEVFGAPEAQKFRHAEVVKHQTLIVWPSKSKPSTGLTSEIIHQWLCLVFCFKPQILITNSRPFKDSKCLFEFICMYLHVYRDQGPVMQS